MLLVGVVFVVVVVVKRKRGSSLFICRTYIYTHVQGKFNTLYI